MRVLVIGGNRFFGKRLVKKLIEAGDEVTMMSRGKTPDDFGDSVQRIVCDRNDTEKLKTLVEDSSWDVIYDQVCFDYPQAKAASEVFSGKVGRYIFTSSQSVYENGKDIKESAFQPSDHQFSETVTSESNYAEAKRQAECGFHRHADFPVVSVRFPIVLGTDDYTERLLFHIRRIRDKQPIYFPDINAHMNFVDAQVAADVLFDLGRSAFTGPINVANQGKIALSELVRMVEEAVGAKLIAAESEKDGNHSPYGVSSDWYMDMGLLGTLGKPSESVDVMVKRVISESLL